MKPLEMIPVAEATDQQIVEFLEALNIPVSDKKRGNRSALMAVMESAQVGQQGIFVANPVRTTVPDSGVHDFLSAEWDEDNETWVHLRILPDVRGGDETSPVYASINYDKIHMPRGVDIVVRERWVRNLNQAHEGRTIQFSGSEADAGTTKKLAEAKRTEVQKYPFTFYGTLGRVKDGPPKKVPAGAKVFATG